MKGDESKDNPNSVEDVFRKAFNSMCLSLDRFGPTEVLHLLIANSHNDIVCRDLLLRFPTVVVLGEFLSTLPVIKVNKRTLKRLQRKGWLIG
jgi:hypothetical protein